MPDLLFGPIHFFSERRSPLTPARERGFDCALKFEWPWRIELAAGQVLRATPCSTLLFEDEEVPLDQLVEELLILLRVLKDELRR